MKEDTLLYKPAGALLLLILAAACSTADAGPEWLGSVTDSSGVRIVHNPTDGLWTPESTWQAVEEIRIGEISGEAEYQFGSVVALDVDADGNIYALDQQAQEVRVFDAEGLHLVTLGGPGSGPGELGRASAGVFVGPGDTVLVPDLANARVNLYEPGGAPAGSYALALQNGVPIRWKLDRDGRLLGQLRSFPVPGQEGPSEPTRDPIVAYGTDGTITDTLHSLPPGQSIERGPGGAPRVTLFSPEPIWDLAPNGSFVSAMNSAYRVEFWDDAGRLTQVLERDVTRSEITESDQETVRELLRKLIAEQGVPPQAAQAVIEGMRFAEFYPAFLNMLVAADGSVWLQQIQTADALAASGAFNPQDLGSSSWDVFDHDGRYLGILEFPPKFTPLKILGDDVYGVLRDDLDVQYLTRFRIDRPTL